MSVEKLRGISNETICISGCVWGLRLLEVRIEEHTIRGNNSMLECRYDLQGETLYSVKWYKDGDEFYRYVPRDDPPAQLFPLPGVHVNVSQNPPFPSIPSHVATPLLAEPSFSPDANVGLNYSRDA